MTRPAPGDPYPFSRGDVASMCGVGVPTIKNLIVGKVLPKRRRGTGNHHGFDMDDAVRILLSKRLLHVGLQVRSIQSLFDSFESPPSKPWAWLRTPEARASGAALVLVLGHPMGPDPAHTGRAYLTTAAEAVEWLKSKRSVICIDVNALIAQIEERTGQPYEAQPAERTVSRDEQQ